MKVLNSIIISLFEKPVRLFVNTAITSAPSITPPLRITSPTPVPIRIPPKIAINNLSDVTGWISTNNSPTARSKIAMLVWTAKVFPIFLYPRKINGILNNRMNMMILRCEISCSRIDIPVMPPSIKRLGIMNPFIAKTAIALPIIICNRFLTFNTFSHWIESVVSGFVM